jgi:hypothetical protein
MRMSGLSLTIGKTDHDMPRAAYKGRIVEHRDGDGEEFYAMSLSAVAKELGTSKGAVKYIQQCAIRKLWQRGLPQTNEDVET